jgi:hypothetical protein
MRNLEFDEMKGFPEAFFHIEMFLGV